MNLTVTPSAAALDLSVSADGTTYSLDVGTASPVNLSVSGGRGPAGIGNATLAAGDGITIDQSGTTATISSTRNSLGDLADVTLSSPSAGEVLTWNGTTWTAAADSTNLSGYATESYVDSAVANLVDSSPAALDTLNELAAAIGDDANFSATITASLAGKASLNHTHEIADVTGLQAALDAKAASGNYTLIGHTHTSANITDFAAAASANAPIQSVNCLTGDIVLVAGTGLTLGQSGTTLTFDADLPPSNLADLADVSGSPAANQALIYNGTEWQPGNIPAGTTLNGLSGNLTLAAGDNVTLTVANSTLTFSASGGGVGSLDAGTFPRGDSLLAESGDTLTSEAGDQLSPEQATSTSSAVIQLLRSNVAASAPSSLAAGELAINTEDELLFYANAAGAVQSFALSDYAAASHAHAIANVTGLQAALDEKAATASLANVATSGNYSDLANIPSVFAPTDHKSTHATGGSDALTPSDIGAAPLASPTFTGVITVSAGTAAAPAIISGTGTSNTGVFWPAADTFAVSTAGTERLRVDSAGHVAVNKTPRVNTQFEVVSDAASAFTLILDGTASTDYSGRSGMRMYNGAFLCDFAIDPISNTYGFSGGNSGGSQVIQGGMSYADIQVYPNQWVKINDQLQASSGTSAVPSHAFIADTDTGTFSPAANTFAISTGGTERLRVDSSGNVGIGTTSPSASLDINSDKIRLRTTKTPASAGDTGNAGDICWDSSYIYVCVATNTWRRIAHSTW